jgi:hypothetical protein
MREYGAHDGLRLLRECMGLEIASEEEAVFAREFGPRYRANRAFMAPNKNLVETTGHLYMLVLPEKVYRDVAQVLIAQRPTVFRRKLEQKKIRDKLARGISLEQIAVEEGNRQSL